jgi:hypothetical protein
MDKILDRNSVIESVKQLIPAMQQSSDPEGELLRFASERKMAPEMLGAIAKAINTLKTQSVYATAKEASERGRSFSTIDTEALLDKYAKQSMPNIVNMSDIVKDNDDYFTVEVQDIKKVAADHSDDIQEGNISELFESEFKHIPSDADKAFIGQTEIFFDSEVANKFANNKEEQSYTEQDYLDLAEELDFNLSGIEHKFAKFFNPSNTKRDKEFYEIVQDTKDLYNIYSEDFDNAAVKLANVLHTVYGLGEYVLQNDDNTKQVWGARFKRASHLAPDHNYDISDDLYDYYTNCLNLKVVNEAISRDFYKSAATTDPGSGPKSKPTPKPKTLYEKWLNDNGYIDIDQDTGQIYLATPETGDPDWEEFVRTVPYDVLEELSKSAVVPDGYVSEILAAKEKILNQETNDGANASAGKDDEYTPNFILNGKPIKSYDDSKEKKDAFKIKYPAVFKPNDLVKAKTSIPQDTTRGSAKVNWSNLSPTGSSGGINVPPIDLAEAATVAKDISMAPYKFLYQSLKNSKPVVNKTEGALVDEINKVKSEEFFNDLMTTDPVLSKLNHHQRRELADIYQAAKDYYPDLVRNKTVLKTFLRQGVETGGMDLNTVSILNKMKVDGNNNNK